MDYKLLLHNYAAGREVAGWPRQRLIHACLRAAILDGSLPAGARLLASRELVAELGIARNTVLYAYDQLATERLVRAGARGTVVAHLGLAATAPPNAAELPLARREPGRADLCRPGRRSRPENAAGRLPGRRAGRALQRGPGVHHQRQPVRAGVVRQHLRRRGRHGLAENPGYAGAVAAFRAAQLRTVGIAVDEGGMAPRAADWTRQRPRLIYLTPSHQYPTGSVLDLPRRLAMLAQARQAGALIIEDDYDSEFRYDGPPLPAMQGLQADAPVIYLGTFSQTMFPALRTGFMVVPAGLVAPLRTVLARMAPHGRAADQLALADFLRSGQFSLHLRRMRRLYRSRRDALLAALMPLLDESIGVHGSSAGMHLTLRFMGAGRDTLVDTEIAAAALAQGVVARALSEQATSLTPSGWTGLMLGYSQVDAGAMADGVAVLARLLGR